MVVSNVGADPTTLTGLLKAFSKGAAGASLIDGIVTDGYLPPPGDASNSWIALFDKIHDQYIPKLPKDGNVLYGMAMAYTFVDALTKAGPNPTPPGSRRHAREGRPEGPGPRPVPLQRRIPRGLHRRPGRQDRGRRVPARGRAGRPPTTARARSPTTRRPSPRRPATGSPPPSDTHVTELLAPAS